MFSTCRSTDHVIAAFVFITHYTVLVIHFAALLPIRRSELAVLYILHKRYAWFSN